VTEAEARAMLGTVARDHVVSLAERLATADAAELIRHARALEEWAPDHAQLLDELAALLTRIALKQVVPQYEGDELYPPELLERLAGSLAPEDVQLYYQTAIIGRRDLPLAPDPRTGFEMTLLRMIAFRPAGAGAGEAASDSSRAARLPAAARGERAAASAGAASASEAPQSARSQPTAPPVSQSWAAILAQLDLQGAARQLASHCVLIGREGAVVRLGLDPRNQVVRTRAQEEKLAQALSRFYGESVRVEIVVGEGRLDTPAEAEQRASAAELGAVRQALEDDPTVRALKERFGATLLEESVRPAK